MMILHQQLPNSKKSVLLPWFAVHVESLSLHLCIQSAPSSLTVKVAQHFAPDSAVFTNCTSNLCPGDIQQLIAQDFQKSTRIKPFTAKITSPISSPNLTSQTSDPPPPEWILLNDIHTGITPAILHTTDPVFVALADTATALLKPASCFRSTIDLPVEGWAYWWEDAQRAFEKLTLESIQAHGITVPQYIIDQK